jgi:proteasome lid subunit RPN8/RPN11
MIRVSPEAWSIIERHLERAYPKEGCGILLGTQDGENREAAMAIPCRNAYEGEQEGRFQLDPEEQLAAERRARELGLSVVAIFHSHPDCDAYFSSTDLRYSCPWYSNIVVSVQRGRVHHAQAFLANFDQTESSRDELIYPNLLNYAQDSHSDAAAPVRR